jgi:hypothetical protein
MMSIISLLVSVGIVAFGWIESRKFLQPYRSSVVQLKKFRQKLESCHEGLSFREVLSGWLKSEDATVHLLALRLHRLCNREPLSTRGKAVWVVDIDQLCDAKMLFRTRLEFERIQSMPALLTGVGILFTFMGLSLGVMGLDPTNAAQLTSGVRDLLGGMSLAFMTSIAGVGTSLWWNSRQRHIRGDFEDVVSELSQVLLAKTYLIQPEELNDLLIMYQADQAQALTGMGDTVSRAIQQGLEAAGINEIKDLLRERDKRSEQLGGLTKVLADLKRQLALLSEGFVEMKNAQLKALDGMVPGMGLAAAGDGNVPASFSQQQQQLFAETAKALKQYGSLNQQQGSLIQNLENSSAELMKLMKAANVATADILSSHSAVTQHMQQLEKHWQRFSDQINRMQKKLDQSIDQFETSLVKGLQQTHAEVDGLISQSLKHFSKAMEGMDQNLAALHLLLKETDSPKKGGWLNRG